MRALVTGAAGGIGSAIAAALAAAGADVVAQDLVPVERPAAATAWVASQGDLLDSAYLGRLQAEVGAPLDAVVAAHGIGHSDALVRLSDEDVERMIRINFLSVTRLFAAFRDRLGDARGAFVAIASQAGLAGVGNASTYSTSKFALIGWLTAIAHSGAATGIRVRALCPGPVDTPLLRSRMEYAVQHGDLTEEEWMRWRLSGVPAGRLADPDELGRFVCGLLELRTPGPVVVPVTGGEVLF